MVYTSHAWSQPRKRGMDRITMFLLAATLAAVRCGCDANYTRNDFPRDFAFGSGTSAYQVWKKIFSSLFFFFFVSSEEGIFVWSLKSGKELIMKMGKSLASGILMFTLVSLSIFSVWILVKPRLLVFTLLTPILELKLLPPKISRCLTNFLTLTSILEIQWFQQVT